MRSSLSKLIFIISCMIGISINTNAQTWTVGVAMNQLVISNFAQTGSGLLTGCFPSASSTFHTYLPTVAGIQYYWKITSIDPNSAYLMPGNDTLIVGDSVAVNSGSDTRTLYYFAGTAITSFKADLYAAGTPTTSGQFYPCNISTQLWISNMMICPEGLSAQVSGSCAVQSNPTLVEQQVALSSLTIEAPNAYNHYHMQVNGITEATDIKLYSVTGEIIVSQKGIMPTAQVDCSALGAGIYFITLSNEKGIRKEKVLIAN